MPPKWTKFTDDSDNVIYQAASAIHDDEGNGLLWHIGPLEYPGAWGIDETDPELLANEDCGLEFGTLAEAKAYCEKREAELIAAEGKV